MRITAGQTTDSNGYRSVGGGIFVSELRAGRLGDNTIEDVWSVKEPNMQSMNVGRLTDTNKYSLLRNI